MRIPLSEAVSDTIDFLREIGESDCEKAAEAAYMADVLEESWPQT